MLNKKFLLGTILTAAVCLSACSNGGAEVTETTSGTTSEITSAETKTAAETTTSAETAIAAETSAKNEKMSVEEYFASRGFAVSKRYKDSRNADEITLDMNDYKNIADPFADLDKKYLNSINYVVLLNADGCNIDFVSKLSAYETKIKDYSGSVDFDIKTGSITFDNYMGGDLSTLKCSEQSYNVCFENYSGEYPLNGLPKDEVYNFCFENFADGVDFGFIAEYPNVTRIRLEGRDTKNLALDFIGDCKNLKNVSVKGKSIDAEAWAEVLKNTDLGGLYVEVEEYSSAEADILMKAAPTRSISYNLDDSPWLGYYGTPTEGVVFYANLYVNTGGQVNDYECKTDSAQAYSPSTWGYHGSLVSTFTNFTETEQKINSVKIFKNDGGVFTEMPFADGSTLHEIDFTVAPESNSDFDITEEIFPFSKCETGIYKAVFDWDGTQLEQQFVINNETEDFLTDEQREIYDKAYEITDGYFGCSIYLPPEYADEITAEEFLSKMYEGYTRDYAYSKSLGKYIDEDGNLKAVSGDRGGDISVQENFFMPIYSNEKEVLFKNFVIHGHEDYPYYIWFEEINYHMVKTDEGWRFDKFDLWY